MTKDRWGLLMVIIGLLLMLPAVVLSLSAVFGGDVHGAQAGGAVILFIMGAIPFGFGIAISLD